MRWLKRIKFIFNVRRFVPFVIDFFKSPDVPVKDKAMTIALVIGYMLFPFDLIPDVLLFLGLVDDISILLFILQHIVKLAPTHLQEKHGLIRKRDSQIIDVKAKRLE